MKLISKKQLAEKELEILRLKIKLQSARMAERHAQEETHHANKAFKHLRNTLSRERRAIKLLIAAGHLTEEKVEQADELAHDF